MLEILDGFADNVVAVKAVGRVTRQDYEAVLIPRIDAAARQHARIGCYYELAADYASMEPGAMWEDFTVAVEYWTRWERIAVVTDVAWIAHVVGAFRFLMAGQLRVFPTGDRSAARIWVAAP